MTIKVGDKFPSFNLKAVVGKPFAEINMDNVFIDINEQSFPNQWLVIFFYPKDFTFVCPTEIAAFSAMNKAFQDRDTQVIAASTDSEFVHWAWRRHQQELKELPFPMLSDIKRELSQALGILDNNEGVAQRATFIIDPEGIVRFSMVTDLNVGRNPNEVLRVLDALQTGELCPCNWQKGEQPISVDKKES